MAGSRKIIKNYSGRISKEELLLSVVKILLKSKKEV
jgi:hypothetical protein